MVHIHITKWIYQRLRITKFYSRVFISPVGVQNRDLVQKVPVGTLQNIIDSLCFLIVCYLDSYYINVCLYRLEIMNEGDTTQ